MKAWADVGAGRRCQRVDRRLALLAVGLAVLAAGLSSGCIINTGTLASGNASGNGSKNQIGVDATMTGKATVTASGQVDNKTAVETNTTTTVGVTAGGQIIAAPTPTPAASVSATRPTASPTPPGPTTPASGTPSPAPTVAVAPSPSTTVVPTATAPPSAPSRSAPSLTTARLVVTTLAGSGVAGGTNGPGTSASFDQPLAAAVNGTSALYLLEQGGNRLRRIDLTNQNHTVTTLAGSGTPGFCDGIGTATAFNSPSAVAADASGTLYVADTLNDVIRKIDMTDPSNPIVTTFAGIAGVAGSADGAAASSTFNGPMGIAVSATGDVYVADTGNHRIRRISGGAVTTVAGSSPGAVDGPGPTAAFDHPGSLAIDASGKLDICDTGNHRIRQLDTSVSPTVVTTLAGSTAGFADGAAAAARFNGPTAIAAYPGGSVVVLDSGNLRIRAILPTGVVETIAGNGNAGNQDGIGLDTTIDATGGLAVDPMGTIYLTDATRGLLRAMSASAGS